jgi:hypothetical protein
MNRCAHAQTIDIITFMKQTFFIIVTGLMTISMGVCAQEKTDCDFCGEYRFDNFSKSEQTYSEEDQMRSRRSSVVNQSFGEDYYSYWNELQAEATEVNQLVKEIYFKDQKLELKEDGKWTFYVKVLETFEGDNDFFRYSVERKITEEGSWSYFNDNNNYINLSRHSSVIESEIHSNDYALADIPIAEFPFYKRLTYKDDSRPFEIIFDKTSECTTLATLGEDETIQNRSIYAPSYSICEGNIFTTMSPYEGKKLTLNK